MPCFSGCYPACDKCKPKFVHCAACGKRTFLICDHCPSCGAVIDEEQKQSAIHSWRENKEKPTHVLSTTHPE